MADRVGKLKEMVDDQHAKVVVLEQKLIAVTEQLDQLRAASV
jgi:hypothetical protein